PPLPTPHTYPLSLHDALPISNLAACRAARKPLLTGTTGFAAELEGAFAAAARDIPLLVAANTSLGVTLLLELVRIAARTLPTSLDRKSTRLNSSHLGISYAVF